MGYLIIAVPSAFACVIVKSYMVEELHYILLYYSGRLFRVKVSFAAIGKEKGIFFYFSFSLSFQNPKL